MTQQEFETRTGINVSPGVFENINRLYLAAGEMDKDVFCEDYKQHQDIMDSRIVSEILDSYEVIKSYSDALMKEVSILKNQLEAARANTDAYIKQLQIAEEKTRLQRELLNKVVEDVNLNLFDELRVAFEDHFGKVATMRARREAGWSLSNLEIDYLLDRCVEG